MSDEMPAWAKAMEERTVSRTDAMEHRLIVEISKALADAEARLSQRIDAVAERGLNDAVVAMDVADRAERAVAGLRDDVGSHNKELRLFWQRLRALEQYVYHGPKPPEAA